MKNPPEPGTRLVYAVQTISRRTRRAQAGADEGDLPWKDVPGHVDYDDAGKAYAAADEFDAAFEDHSHRVISRRVAAVEPPPPVAAPPPAPKLGKPKPAKPPSVQRQLAEHRAFEGYERNRDALIRGLGVGWTREQLDPFVELCRIHLETAGASVRAHHYRKEIEELAGEVAEISHLRVVS